MEQERMGPLNPEKLFPFQLLVPSGIWLLSLLL